MQKLALSGQVILRMAENDIPSAVEIERSSSASPWTEAQFSEELRKGFSRFWVLRKGERVVGFGGFWLVAGEAQIANIAVHPDFRRQGIGRSLLREMMQAAKAQEARFATLEVRERNSAARALYESEGFHETHRRPRYYEGREAALLMEKDL